MRLALLFLVAGCAHGVPHAAHLTVARQNGSVRAIVHARVAGAPIDLLVDTGAVRSIVPIGFVRRHHLATRHFDAPDKVVDINGRSAEMVTLAHAPLQLEDGSKTSLDFLVNPDDHSEGPGILAPQDLLRAGQAMVIDLPGEQLRYESEAAALRPPSLKKLDYRGCLFEGPFSNHRLVTVSIDGVPAAMIVDTGAERTVLLRNNPALPTMQLHGTEREMRALSSVGGGVLADGIAVEFAAAAYRIEALVLPSTQPCAEGLLGADVLSRCTLVWGKSDLRASCRSDR
jgi:predicted aspartyl protease